MSRNHRKTGLQHEDEIDYRGLLERVSDSVFVKDRSRRYTQVNSAMERLFGMSAAQMVGRTDDELFGEDASRYVREVDSRVLAGETVEDEQARIIHGVPGTFRVVKLPLRDRGGKVKGLCGIARDVSGHRRAERAAEAARADLENLFRSIDDMAIVVDREHEVLRVNDTARHWLEAASDKEILGRKCYEAFHSRSEPCPGCPVKLAFSSGKPVRIEKQSEGLDRFLSVSASPILDEGGRVVKVIEIARDITARKLAERELERHRKHLEELVEERTEGLRKAQGEMVRREKLATLGQVAGSVAHELRNPLGTIRNATYLLNMTVGRDLKGKAVRHLELINSEIARSDRIITSLLDFARGRPCNPEPCNLAETFRDAEELAELGDDVRVEYDIPDDLAPVIADDSQMTQAFLNLFRNAGQAMNEHGVISVTARATDGVVRVRILDQGPGIEPEVMRRLFEPLFSTRTFGVGLGLPICRSFIEANNGTLEVESEIGRGTTFTVTLPVAEPGSSQAGSA